MTKQQLILVTVLLLAVYTVFGQNVKVPKNIKSAIVLLNVDCSDSLKEVIKQTENNKLVNLAYPWGNYKTIDQWLDNDNKKSKLREYFIRKSIFINIEQQAIILIAFKQHLLDLPINEKEIFDSYLQKEKIRQEENKIRFTTDTLQGVYIPKDIEDCFKQIDSFWADSVKNEVKEWTEEELGINAHFGFGMWVRNNWQLWGGSRLSKYFNDMGVFHPDDMSGTILTCYHRYLNNKDIGFKEQIQHHKNYWEEVEKEKVEQEQNNFAKYKIGDTLYWSYKYGYVSEKQESNQYLSCDAKGIVIERNENKFWIKIKLIESCDKKGIIAYDNNGTVFFNEKTRKWEKNKKRVIKRMKKGEKMWFHYSSWEIDEDI